MSTRIEIPAIMITCRHSGGVSMVEILNTGLIENDDQLLQLTEGFGQLVIPNETDDPDLTHWWVIKDAGTEILYLGSPDTFTTYIIEKTGGIQ
jgi:hypothetical protein